VIKSNQTKGIKLDFKSIGALEASLPILNKLKPKLRMPIWINSDVITGPNSITKPRNATLFFSLIREQFPDVTISPGWTTCKHKHNALSYDKLISLKTIAMKKNQTSLCISKKITVNFKPILCFHHIRFIAITDKIT